MYKDVHTSTYKDVHTKDVHTSKVVVDDLCHFNLLKRYPDISSSDSCDIVSELFAVPDIIGDVLHNEVVTNKLALASCHGNSS